MGENLFKCSKCGWQTGNETFFFCLRCGGDLGRGAIRVDCCDRLVADPKIQELGFVLYCPFCGKKTGQISPAARAARQAEQDRRLALERERFERAVHPPLLEGLRVKVRPFDPACLVLNLLTDIQKCLEHNDNRLLVIAETDRIQELFESFKSSVGCPVYVEPLLEIGQPTPEKLSVISGKFQTSKILFTTGETMARLNLPFANRFFVCLRDVPEDFLESLGRLSSPANRSRNPALFDYGFTGEPSVSRRGMYQNAGATILNNE